MTDDTTTTPDTDDAESDERLRKDLRDIRSAKSDPVDVAEDFYRDASERGAKIEDRLMAQLDEQEALGQWLVAEARWQRDQARARAGAAVLKLAEVRVGATLNYVHDDAKTINDPRDFIAWFLDLGETERVKTAERILRHSEEAAACFYQDHTGRIQGLEGHIALLNQRRTQGGVAPGTETLDETIQRERREVGW